MMLQFALDFRLDCLAFAVIAIVGSAAAHLWVRHRCNGSLSLCVWGILALVVLAGTDIAEFAGDHERARMRDMLQAVAPVYAMEVERLGHAKFGFDTSPKDPV